MGCETIKVGDKVAFACSHGGRKAPRCAYCHAASTQLCDGKIDAGKVCSKPMCAEHVYHRNGALEFCRSCGPRYGAQPWKAESAETWGG